MLVPAASEIIGSFVGTENYDDLAAIMEIFSEAMLRAQQHEIAIERDGMSHHISIRFWGGGDAKIWSVFNGMEGDYSSNLPNIFRYDASNIDRYTYQF